MNPHSWPWIGRELVRLTYIAAFVWFIAKIMGF